MSLYLKTFSLAYGRRAFNLEINNNSLCRRIEVRNLFAKKRLFQHKEERYWFSKRSFFTRWTPIGIVLYTTYIWKRGFSDDITNIEVKFYCHLPFRTVSKLFGKLANMEVPLSARPYIYGKYSQIYNVNLEEAAVDDLTQYDTLVSFFTRNLKNGVRTIDQKSCLVSPCDGKVLSFGPVVDGRVEQVKGVTYSLQQFFGKNSWLSKFNDNVDFHNYKTKLAMMQGRKHKHKNPEAEAAAKAKKEVEYLKSLLTDPENTLHHCIIYLAPGDYHRFHSPCEWLVKLRRHFSGKLLSVNPIMAKMIPALFCMNERAVYIGDWKYGFFSFTAVGATNVGSIKVFKDDALHTNGKKRKKFSELILDPYVDYERGEMVGQFNMGSTIVLIFEAPKDFQFSVQPGDTVKMGVGLGWFEAPPSVEEEAS